jgi:hypothetical protein
VAATPPSGRKPCRSGEPSMKSAASPPPRIENRPRTRTPVESLDEPFGDLRHDERADPDARHRKAGGEPAPAHEPALHGPDRRHIGEADPDADPKPVAEIDVPERLGAARDDEAEADDRDAGQRHAARAEPVG